MSTGLESLLRASRMLTILLALIDDQPLPLGRFIPEPWPGQSLGGAGTPSGVAGVAL